MKKFYVVIILFFLPMLALAEVIPHKIYAIVEETITPKKYSKGDNIHLHIIDIKNPSEEITNKEGERITVKITEYVKPKRGKKDGYFNVTYKETDNLIIDGKMRTSTPKDLKEIAKDTGVSVVGRILKIPGFSQAVAFSTGLIKPEENKSRIKTASENLYESTPLTYIESGKDFFVERDGIVVLKLKVREKK